MPIDPSSAAESLRQLKDLYREQHEYALARDDLVVPRRVVPRVANSKVVLVAQGLAQDTQRFSGLPYMFDDQTLSEGGDTLDRFLAGFGHTINPNLFDRTYAYHTDVTPLFTGRLAGGGDIRPSGAQANEASQWVEREMEIIVPRVVVALGHVAATRLLQRYAVTPQPAHVLLRALVRQEHQARIAGRVLPLFVVYHPSGAKRHRPESQAVYDWTAARIHAILDAAQL